MELRSRSVMVASIKIFGWVISGRGSAANQIKSNQYEIEESTGEKVINGSFNVVLDIPILLDIDSAIKFDDNYRFLWRGKLNGIDVWNYRWAGAPLHVVEVLSSQHLRKSLGLIDGDRVTLELPVHVVRPVPKTARIVWAIFWYGRREWYYRRHPLYFYHAKIWCSLIGANQSGNVGMLYRDIKEFAEKTSVVSRMLNYIGARKNRFRNYSFKRINIDKENDATDRPIKQIRNLLNYTKTSNSSYSARKFPAGYHTIKINGEILQGQRDPSKRFAAVPENFEGKTVLDIGMNQGGMLFDIGNKVKWGVGIDYDYRMVNAANRIKTIRNCNNLSFYVFDLEKDPLGLILDILPEQNVDIVFLLSVCMWIKNWREVIKFSSEISRSMLFETNGSSAQQASQEKELKNLYRNVIQLTETSEDDPGQKNRRLFYCTEPHSTFI